MSQAIFQTPSPIKIGGHSFLVSKVPFDSFDAAVTFGQWLIASAGGVIDLAALERLRGDSDVNMAVRQLLAACLAVDGDGGPRQITVQDVGAMPLPMVLEAVYVVLEANLDFFIQSLAAIRPIQARLLSIGSLSPSSSLQPDTAATRSGGTAMPN